MLRRGEIIQGVGDNNFGNLATACATLDDTAKQQIETLWAGHEYKYGQTKSSQAGNSITSRRTISHHPWSRFTPTPGKEFSTAHLAS